MQDLPGAPISGVRRGSHFLWQLENSPLSVRLNLDVVERMGLAVLEGFKSVPRRGLEVGGVLVGRAEQENGRTTVTVEGFLPLDCEHLHGPSFLLSQVDRKLLNVLVKGRSDVVGLYRSNTRAEFATDELDAALMYDLFGSAVRPFLLIKPAAATISAARIYTWRGRVLHAAPETADFPFQPGRLIPEDYPAVETARTVAAQPVPKPVWKPAPKPEPKRQLEPEPAPAPALDPAGARPALAEVAARALARRWKLPAAVAAVAAAVVLLAITVRSDGPVEPAKPAIPARQTAPAKAVAMPGDGLALNVRRDGESLLVAWDRDAGAVRSASRGVMWITDSSRLTHMDLDSRELETGSILYTPATTDVSFRLELFSSRPQAAESPQVSRAVPPVVSPVEVPAPAPPPRQASRLPRVNVPPAARVPEPLPAAPAQEKPSPFAVAKNVAPADADRVVTQPATQPATPPTSTHRFRPAWNPNGRPHPQPCRWSLRPPPRRRNEHRPLV